MATTGTGEPTPGGQGTMGSGQTPEHASPDRRASSESGGIGQTLRETTYRKLDDQKMRTSETLGSVAGAVRGMTQPLRDSGKTGMAEYIDKAADGIDRWASQLRNRDVDDAVRALNDFARRQPALFLGLAFGAGAVAARFLKSSSGTGGHGESYGGRWGTPASSSSGGMSSGAAIRGAGGHTSGAGTSGMSSGGTASGVSAGETPRASSEWPSGREVL